MRRALVVGVFVFLLAPAVHASSEVHGDTGWRMLLLQLLNLMILGGVLVYYVKAPLRNFLEQRSRGTRQRMDDAQARLQQAEQELAGLRSRLASFEQEAEEILQRAVAQAEAAGARSLERAEHAAERIRAEARGVADQEIERARIELQAEAAELAVSIARDFLRERLTSEDDRRLTREYIERIGDSA